MASEPTPYTILTFSWSIFDFVPDGTPSHPTVVFGAGVGFELANPFTVDMIVGGRLPASLSRGGPPADASPEGSLNIPEYYIPGMESTTVKVSKETAKKLAVLQHRLHKATLDETIQALVAGHRKELIEESFGADRGRLRTFSEGDRGEDRS